MRFVHELAKLWRLEDLHPNCRSTKLAINNFEFRHGITLPEDVRSFYERFNDLLDGTMDDDLNAVWPLGMIDTVTHHLSDKIPGADELFVFADHSIGVHLYAVRLTPERPGTSPVLWIADEHNFAEISVSFSGFWEAYLASPHRVVVP